MITKTESRLARRGNPELLYRLFRAAAPSSADAEDVKIEAVSGESLKWLKIALFVMLCRSAGLKRNRFGDSGTFGYIVSRQYQSSDLEGSEFLCFRGMRGEDLEYPARRDSTGRLQMARHNANRLSEFGMIDHWLGASQAARQCLEGERFERLQFRQIAVLPEEKTGKLLAWEIVSVITLPKLANTDRLKCYGMGPTGKVEPFTGDYSRMVFIDDPPYAGGEPHYRRSDLERIGPFDIAETFEHLWIPQRSLVISQRLYRLFLDRAIPVIVQPVRIDPD